MAQGRADKSGNTLEQNNNLAMAQESCSWIFVPSC